MHIYYTIIYFRFIRRVYRQNSAKYIHFKMQYFWRLDNVEFVLEEFIKIFSVNVVYRETS